MNQSTSAPLVVGNADFGERVLQSEQPVLVDFWAEWCAPCRTLGPVIESLVEDYEGRATIAKVDVDANQEIAAQFGIRSIPTVILFDKGEIVDTFVGVRPKADYQASLDGATA
ncbi:MAG: thioredoxin [Gammaproteobacteria bacterium]|nr:thioredoxin [Gammaproteobacteria bacterium]